MAIWNPDNILLTRTGEEILSKVQAGIGKITVNRIVTGSQAVAYAQLYNQTNIPGEAQELIIDNVKTDRKGSEINTHLTNATLENEYSLYTLGIYVTHEDYEGEQLYLIAECDTSQPDLIPTPDVTVATMYYSLYMEHKDTDQVVIQINSGGTVTNDMIGQAGGVAGLDDEGKIPDAQIPDSIVRESALKEYPHKVSVDDNTNLTTLIADNPNTAMWASFISPQGPVTNSRCFYVIYPFGSDSVHIDAIDLTDNVAYYYEGVSSEIESSKWNPLSGSSSSGGISYAACNTSAGTGAKVATIPDFAAEGGEVFMLNFTYPNTANLVTLNISNTGAKNVVDKRGVSINNSSASLLSGLCMFYYDGTNYVILSYVGNSTVAGAVRLSDTPSASYDSSSGVAATPAAVANMKVPKWGTCSTAAATVAKLATVENFKLEEGASVLLYFSTVNTASNPTLNINNTGAKNILDKYEHTFASGNASLLSGIVLLVYNGTNYILLENMSNGSQFGLSKLSDAIDSVNDVNNGIASTPKATKSAYDLANSKSQKVSYTSTLLSAGWSGSEAPYTQSLTINGVLSTDTPVIGPVMTSNYETNKAMLEAWSLVSRITTDSNMITAYCFDKKPEVNVPIQLMCMR